MLILDKQKAVERMLALTVPLPEENPEALPELTRARAYQRVAVFERRATPENAPKRRAERRGGQLRPAGGAPSA
jgi:hypothetical protein